LSAGAEPSVEILERPLESDFGGSSSLIAVASRYSAKWPGAKPHAWAISSMALTLPALA
jgi:hypothetical protein